MSALLFDWVFSCEQVSCEWYFTSLWRWKWNRNNLTFVRGQILLVACTQIAPEYLQLEKAPLCFPAHWTQRWWEKSSVSIPSPYQFEGKVEFYLMSCHEDTVLSLFLVYSTVWLFGAVHLLDMVQATTGQTVWRRPRVEDQRLKGRRLRDQVQRQPELQHLVRVRVRVN